MCVYLLHFSEPYVGIQRNPDAKRVVVVRHYIGYAEQLDKRIAAHRAGNGARLVEVLANAGIGFEVARVWPGEGRTFERQLKNRKNSAQLCPICKAAKEPEDVTINFAELEAIPY